MKNKFILSLICVLFSVMSYSQGAVVQGQPSTADKKEKTLEQKMEGTYMIIHTGNKVTELLTTDILLEIEKRREETKEIYYVYSQYITIKILPRSVITAPDFDPKKY
ncbi:MAG: hypothetical protein A3F72_12215 [Bacteroidetes bacterium RIFCSPLOWO2_12_FULL_35_15]|nr:MAG: hypothetical protein A3F72_12215 [Bacteroidetes bacterium RIFCSPLOWO2_12_FULL_35_15]